MARSPREARPRILTVAGVRVALLSYTYGLNGFRLPRGRPWLVNLLHPGRILADARVARRAGSQFTVVFLHWGQEYRSAPTPGQRTLASELLADPSVDLIVGHHAHVVQPVRRLHGKWVAFGMGNSLSAQSAACCPAATQDGVLLQVTVVAKAGRYVVDKVRYTPTWVEHPSYRIRPVLGRLPGARPAPRCVPCCGPRCTARPQPSGVQPVRQPDHEKPAFMVKRPPSRSTSGLSHNRKRNWPSRLGIRHDLACELRGWIGMTEGLEPRPSGPQSESRACIIPAA
jgi:Bacterial capsule synthesis protein PGA_cap